MAKKYPFTRTIKKQTVVCLVFDKNTAEASNTTVTFPAPIEDEKKLFKACEKALDNEKTRLIEIIDTRIEEKVYGLTAEQFMAAAVELDPKTRKPITET